MSWDEVTAVAINGHIIHAHSRAKAEQWVQAAHRNGDPNAHIVGDPPPDPPDPDPDTGVIDAGRWSPCPICHTEPTSFSTEAETILVSDLEPAWEPDGPLISVPFTERHHTVGWTYTLHPCGHHVPREAVRYTVTTPPAATTAAQRRGVNAQRWGAH